MNNPFFCIFILISVAACGGTMAQAQGALVDVSPPKNSGCTVWRGQPSADCPFAQSETLTGLAFTGRYSDYHCGDTWYPSWASDGNLYSPWTDGKTLWLCYSANFSPGWNGVKLEFNPPGRRYGLCLHEVKLFAQDHVVPAAKTR